MDGDDVLLLSDAINPERCRFDEPRLGCGTAAGK